MIIYALAGKIYIFEKSKNRKNPENRFLAIKSLIFVKTVLNLTRIWVSLRTNRKNMKIAKIYFFPDFTSNLIFFQKWKIANYLQQVFVAESSKPYNPVKMALKPR